MILIYDDTASRAFLIPPASQNDQYQGLIDPKALVLTIFIHFGF